MFRLLITTIALLALNAHSYKFDASKLRARQDTLELQVNQFVRELTPVLDKPLSWCKVDLTGNMKTYSSYQNKTEIAIEVKATCDEHKQRSYLKALWFKYRKLLGDTSMTVANMVKERVRNQYPDIEVQWGIALNDFEYIAIKKKEEYGGTPHFNNKSFFFEMDINGTRNSELYRLEMPGELLIMIKTNQVPDVFTYSAYFLVELDDYMLSNDLNIDIIPVWHTTLNPTIEHEYMH